jgi:hypothetical protein
MGLADRIAALQQLGAPEASPTFQPYLDLLKEFCVELERRCPVVGGWELQAWPKHQPNWRVSLLTVYADDLGGVIIGERRLPQPAAFEDWLVNFYQNQNLEDSLAGLAERSDAEVEGYLLLRAETGGTRGAFQVVMANEDFRTRLVAPSEGAAVAECKVKVALYQFNGSIQPPTPGESGITAEFAGHEIKDATVQANPTGAATGWTWIISGTRGKRPTSPKRGRPRQNPAPPPTPG